MIFLKIPSNYKIYEPIKTADPLDLDNLIAALANELINKWVTQSPLKNNIFSEYDASAWKEIERNLALVATQEAILLNQPLGYQLTSNNDLHHWKAHINGTNYDNRNSSVGIVFDLLFAYLNSFKKDTRPFMGFSGDTNMYAFKAYNSTLFCLRFYYILLYLENICIIGQNKTFTVTGPDLAVFKSTVAIWIPIILAIDDKYDIGATHVISLFAEKYNLQLTHEPNFFYSREMMHSISGFNPIEVAKHFGTLYLVKAHLVRNTHNDPIILDIKKAVLDAYRKLNVKIVKIV